MSSKIKDKIKKQEEAKAKLIALIEDYQSLTDKMWHEISHLYGLAYNVFDEDQKSTLAVLNASGHAYNAEKLILRDLLKLIKKD